jgi:tetratricopeptide (TPR) repeat protein
MSRSIHTTRRHLQELKRADYADRKARRDQLRRARDQIARKRQIKAQVWRERHTEQISGPPVAIEAIPIEVRDTSTFVHYPAGVEDLRAVMRLLPPGTLDGLTKIVLCLGAEQRRYRAIRLERGLVLDPYVRRVGMEILPGVYGGQSFGTYLTHSATIRIYAYVYRSDLPERDLWELYLRLEMLSTFAHEIAHHQEELTRIARGRWLAEPGDKSEQYARRIEYDWVQQLVIGYLEQTYPDVLQAFYTWMAHHGGVAVPLALLADDPAKHVFHASWAFLRLVAAVDAGAHLLETRIEFARELHYGEYYAQALESLAVVLTEHPDNAEALILQADIYEHQQRYDEAEALLAQVLTHDPAYTDAWFVRMDICRARADWRRLAEAATQAIKLYTIDDWEWRTAHEQRICAQTELGNFEQVEQDIQVLAQFQSKHERQIVAALRAILLLRKGQHAEALQAVQNCEPFQPGQRSELRAVRLEAAYMLGRRDEAGVLSTDDLKQLRARGYADWASRLATLI